MSPSPKEAVAKVLREHASGRVLIAPHINPDGDAIGSAAAFAHIAASLGADVRLLLISGVPDYLSWLPLPWAQAGNLKELGGWTPDLLIVTDCGDIHRAGPEIAAFLRGEKVPPGWENTVTVNIDHHLGNPAFAQHNWVESSMSATCMVAGFLAEHLDIPLSGDLGRSVYLGLVSDTGNFAFANTTASCLSMAARIVENGLDVSSFTETYENTWSLARIHLWGRLFSGITLHAGGQVASIVVPRKLLDEFGLNRSALEEFASWLRRIKGVRVGLFVREDGAGHAKVSLRSMGDVNVREVAAAFGGGGHKAAAGAELSLPPYDAEQIVLQRIFSEMEQAGLTSAATA